MHSTNMMIKISSIIQKKEQYQYLNVYDGKIYDDNKINTLNFKQEPFERKKSSNELRHGLYL